MRYMVTGAAGFIGSQVALALLRAGHEVVGVDNLNAYYDPSLKKARLALLEQHLSFSFSFMDIGASSSEQWSLPDVDRVIHLAAQAGVRFSIENPHEYTMSNLVGFANILEWSRRHDVQHLTYASSSSVYGQNHSIPFAEDSDITSPISYYAATKAANEVMASSYSHLYGLPTTGLRLFTVYGPWGRPDMAVFKFTESILRGRPIQLFNNGNHTRDFTYIDDIVAGIRAAADDSPTGNLPSRVVNLGAGRPQNVGDLVAAVESALGREAITIMADKQAGDMDNTLASTSAAHDLWGYSPKTSLDEGIPRFVAWYRAYYER